MKMTFLKTAVLVIVLAAGAMTTHAQNLFTAVSDANAGLSTKELEKLAALRLNPTYTSIQMVQVGDIPALETDGFLDVNIPGLTTYKAVAFHISHPQDIAGDFTWEGSFYIDSTYEDKDTTEGDGNITLYRKNGEVFGYLRPPFSDEIYELASFGPGKNAIIKYNTDYLSAAKEDCGDQEPQNPAARVNSLPCSDIRLLVLYTKKAFNAVPNIYTTIFTALNDLDGATWNSMGNVNQPKFALANIIQLPDNYAEVENPYTSLLLFSGDSYIQGLRDDYAADIVIVLTDADFYDASTNVHYDGISIPGLSTEAYALVEADKCNYKYTFSHEIGHLLGAHHNLCDDGAGYTGCDQLNSGQNHPKKIERFCLFCDNDSKRYETIMWQNNGTSRSHLFSTPDRQIFGKSMGDNDLRNNTRIISDNACTVAGYRSDDAVYYVVAAAGMDVAHTGQSVTLNATPQGGTPPYTYVWKMESGLFNYVVLGSTTSTVTFPMPSQAHAFVKVQCFDAYGRSCTSDKTVTNWDFLTYQPITATPSTLPRIFQPEKEEDITMNVYPNPASEIFTIGLSIPAKDAAKHSLVITDVMGKIVYSTDETGAGLVNIEIDGAKFAAGNYIIKLTGSKEPKITKVAITH